MATLKKDNDVFFMTRIKMNKTAAEKLRAYCSDTGIFLSTFIGQAVEAYLEKK